MSQAAISIVAWGIYMMTAGLGLLFIPNTMLAMVGLPESTDVWIRVAGLLVSILGAYYAYCACRNVIPFFRVTIPGRMAFAVGLIVLVMLGFSGPGLLILAGIDLLGAWWTWLSFRATA